MPSISPQNAFTFRRVYESRNSKLTKVPDTRLNIFSGRIPVDAMFGDCAAAELEASAGQPVRVGVNFVTALIDGVC